MLTLTYGFQKPESGDRSTVWFPALANNVQKLNDHDHDGLNSSLINPASVDKSNFSQTILAADSGGWVSDGSGNYHKDVTVPVGVLEINDYIVKLIDKNTGYNLLTSWNKLTSQSFRIYCNDNTLDLYVRYI